MLFNGKSIRIYGLKRAPGNHLWKQNTKLAAGDKRVVKEAVDGCAAQICVAQICNLPYRRFLIGRRLTWSSRSKHSSGRRMQFCDTAECNSALRSNLWDLDRACCRGAGSRVLPWARNTARETRESVLIREIRVKPPASVLVRLTHPVRYRSVTCLSEFVTLQFLLRSR